VGDNTAIEWTHHTFNPWWGCARVSAGCRFCYAERDARRYGHEVWGQHGPRRMLSEENWRRPLRWNRDAERAGVPALVFCASMADVFEDHPAVAEPRERLWHLIEATPWLRWQLLTKRPENVAGMVPWGNAWPEHVWLGTSVEDQQRAEERVPELLKVAGVQIRFLSVEPLLEAVELRHLFRWCPEHYGPGFSCVPPCPSARRIDWVICGGESGSSARPMHPAWARSIRDQCQQWRLSFLFKQWGRWRPIDDQSQMPSGIGCPVLAIDGSWVDLMPQGSSGWLWPGFTAARERGWQMLHAAGKHAAGRELDGRTWDEFPAAATAGTAR
jgi:protein gp37